MPDLIAALAAAAKALAELSTARSNALRVPTGTVWKTDEERQAHRRSWLKTIPEHRSRAVAALLLAEMELRKLPPLPATFSMPEWPSRTQHGAPATGPEDLAEIVQAGAEGEHEDYLIAEGLQAWCREYTAIMTEVGAAAAA